MLGFGLFEHYALCCGNGFVVGLGSCCNFMHFEGIYQWAGKGGFFLSILVFLVSILMFLASVVGLTFSYIDLCSCILSL